MLRPTAICLSITAFLLTLCGCGAGISSPGNSLLTNTPSSLQGMVHGGQQPVSGAVIQLWAVGTSGDGSAATPLISNAAQLVSGIALTDANGFFNITGQYTCPSASSLVYFTASGGNPGLAAGTNNSAIFMLTALGQCGSLLTSYPFVYINEVTTVVSVAALSPYMSLTGSIGSGTSDASNLQMAFNSITHGVNVATGIARTAAPNGGYAPQAEINTLADIMTPCINTDSPGSTACGMLFSAAKPSGGTAPSNTLAAALDVALNPANNVSTLFGLSTANVAFQPVLSTAPTQWYVPLNYASYCGFSGPGDSVSGTVSYTGGLTGQIYLGIVNSDGCISGGNQGTSISAPGAFTIRGVPPGTYTLRAFLDPLGQGAVNAADPSGGTTFTVTTSNVTGVNLTLANAPTVTLNSAPIIESAAGANNGLTAQLNGTLSGNGYESSTSYTLQWSTSSSFSAIAGSKTVPATGVSSLNALFVNGLTNGSVYYLRAYGTSGGTAVGPYSAVYGPVTIGPPSVGSAVSGSVSYSGTPTGPLLVAVFNQENINAPAYSQFIPSPGSTQAYSVTVPNSSSAVYSVAAIIDQNNDGDLDTGDVRTTGLGNLIAVTGPTANQNVTLSTANSHVAAITQHYLSGSTQSYGITFVVQPIAKLPVGATLLTSANADGANVVGPIDISLCTGYGCGNGFQIGYSLGTVSPNVGDTFNIAITYSDGTSETLTAAVTNVLGASAFATNLAPTTGSSTSTTPTFTWTDPVCAACGSYTYQFSISSPTAQIWGVPNYGNGLAAGTTSVTWGIDPTDPPNVPSGSLTTGVTYSWQVVVQDANFNSAITQVSYNP